MEKYGTARQATDDNIIQRMRFVCWITKATDRHSEYEILIAFTRQQWLHESALILRYTYIACLVNLVQYIQQKIIVTASVTCYSVHVFNYNNSGRSLKNPPLLLTLTALVNLYHY